MKNLFIFILGIALAAGGTYLYLEQPVSAPSRVGNVITQGIIPQIATSSTIVVGPTSVATLFTRASNCTSRLITTVGQPIMLSFSSLVTPSNTIGHIQLSSTTVAYDNAVYGCGAITAFGLGASTTITISAFAQ